MRQEWSPEDLVGCWTLVEGDWDQVGNKSGPTRLGFALLLKFFEVEGRFPPFAEEIPPVAVDYVAGLVKVPAAEFAKYHLTSRAAVFHRAQIREFLGFRESTRADEEPLTAWLAAEICPVELVDTRRREALLAKCLALQVEPPGPTRIERIMAAAAARAEATFCTRTIERLGAAGVGRLLALVDAGNADGGAVLAELKRDPGAVSLDSLLTEIAKLSSVRALALSEDLFADASDKLVGAWRARAIAMYPSDFRDVGADAGHIAGRVVRVTPA